MIPIPKPGRENKNGVSKHRPINLINVGGKALEKFLSTESCTTETKIT
jgi:hypothetical protein